MTAPDRPIFSNVLRGYVAQRALWEAGLLLGFVRPEDLQGVATWMRDLKRMGFE